MDVNSETCLQKEYHERLVSVPSKSICHSPTTMKSCQKFANNYSQSVPLCDRTDLKAIKCVAIEKLKNPMYTDHGPLEVKPAASPANCPLNFSKQIDTDEKDKLNNNKDCQEARMSPTSPSSEFDKLVSSTHANATEFSVDAVLDLLDQSIQTDQEHQPNEVALPKDSDESGRLVIDEDPYGFQEESPPNNDHATTSNVEAANLQKNQCHLCSAQHFPSPRHLYGHMRLCHTEYVKSKWPMCEACKKYFPTKSNLANHVYKGKCKLVHRQKMLALKNAAVSDSTSPSFQSTEKRRHYHDQTQPQQPRNQTEEKSAKRPNKKRVFARTVSVENYVTSFKRILLPSTDLDLDDLDSKLEWLTE